MFSKTFDSHIKPSTKYVFEIKLKAGEKYDTMEDGSVVTRKIYSNAVTANCYTKPAKITGTLSNKKGDEQ